MFSFFLMIFWKTLKLFAGVRDLNLSAREILFSLFIINKLLLVNYASENFNKILTKFQIRTFAISTWQYIWDRRNIQAYFLTSLSSLFPDNSYDSYISLCRVEVPTRSASCRYVRNFSNVMGKEPLARDSPHVEGSERRRCALQSGLDIRREHTVSWRRSTCLPVRARVWHTIEKFRKDRQRVYRRCIPIPRLSRARYMNPQDQPVSWGLRGTR